MQGNYPLYGQRDQGSHSGCTTPSPSGCGAPTQDLCHHTVPVSLCLSESISTQMDPLPHILLLFYGICLCDSLSLWEELGKSYFHVSRCGRTCCPLPSSQQLGRQGTGFPPVLVPLKFIRNLLAHFIRNADFFPEENYKFHHTQKSSVPDQFGNNFSFSVYWDNDYPRC